MRVGIVGQRGNHRAISLVGDVTEALRERGVEVVVDENTRQEFDRGGAWQDDASPAAPVPTGIAVEDLSTCDLAVSVGGDGTFLYAARGADGTPIMGVNLGEVGFLNAVSPDEAVRTVETEIDRIRETGSARTREMPRIAAECGWTLPPALNEVVVQGGQRGHGNGCSIEVRVDGDLYTSGHADGVLVATTTGSTAYNLSEGGPLVHPGVDSFVVTEMCGSESMPPLVVGTDAEIRIRVGEAEEAVAVSDGRLTRSITPPDEVRLERAATPVRVAGPPNDFFTALGKLR